MSLNFNRERQCPLQGKITYVFDKLSGNKVNKNERMWCVLNRKLAFFIKIYLLLTESTITINVRVGIGWACSILLCDINVCTVPFNLKFYVIGFHFVIGFHLLYVVLLKEPIHLLYVVLLYKGMIYVIL